MSNLGYSSTGSIAESTISELNKYKDELYQDSVDSAIDRLQNCKTLDELKSNYQALNPVLRIDKTIKVITEEIKKKLNAKAVNISKDKQIDYPDWWNAESKKTINQGEK